MSPNSSSVHPNDGGPPHCLDGVRGAPNFQQCTSKTEVSHCLDGIQGTPKLQQCASERWGALTAWTGCETSPNSSSMHPKDGGPSLPGQGARCPQTPAVCLKDGDPSLPGWGARCPQTPAVCIRKTGAPHCLDGMQGTPKLQQCAPKRRGALTAWTGCKAPPNSSSVHPKGEGPLTAWTGCKTSPNSSSVHPKDGGGPLTAWTGREAPPNSSSVHQKDGGPHCLDGVQGPPNSSSVHPKGSLPPPSLDRRKRNLGEDSEGFAATKSRDRPWRPESGWSPPLRAGRLAAGPPLTAFLEPSLQGREKGSRQDS